MNHSEQIDKLIPALLECQKAYPSIGKTKEGQQGNRKFKYIPLDQFLEIVTPILNNNGVLLSQGHVAEAGSLIVTTRLYHTSGQWIESEMHMPLVQTDPRSVGSASTYARRYDLQAVLGIFPDDDDDAQAAMPQTEPVQQKQYQKPQAVQETNPRDAIIEDIKETMRLLRLSSAQVHQLTQVKPNTPNIEELTTVKHYLEDLYKRVHNGEILSPAELEAIRGAVS